MKKYLSLLVMLMMSIAMSAEIVSGSCGTDVTYTLNTETGVLKIEGTGAMSDYTSGSAPWYSRRSYVKEAQIAQGVTSIGNSAFFGCSSLTFITIPSSVTSIGNSAFYSCSSLTSITIPNGVTSIGTQSFSGCSSLTSITIPEGVTSIGYRAFYGCDNMTELIYNAKNATVYNGTDNDRSFPTSLTTVTIGNGVEVIPAYFVNNNSKLKSITIPESVTSIGNYAFYNCSSIKSVTIPKSVKTIGNNAFYNCRLRSVTFGTGLLSIGSSAFNGIKKAIWLVNTPPSGYSVANASVNYVPNDQYTSLSNKTVYPFLSSMFTVNGIRYVPVSMSGRTCEAVDCNYDASAENIKIDEVVSYRNVAFKVNEVKPYVCYDNDYIKQVNITYPGNIYQETFYDCDSIQTVNMSNDGYIGSSAFQGCDQLQNITLTNQGDIQQYAFDGCTNLASAIVQNKGIVGDRAFQYCSSMLSCTLGNEVTAISQCAFTGCTSLQDIVIPSSVTSLGQYAFENCSSMLSVATGNGIESIPTYAFTGCTALQKIEIGTGVKTIGTYAFYNCKSLPNINIPKNVTSIGNNALNNCTALKTVILDNRTTNLSLGSNGSNPLFCSCPLDSVYIGGKITYNTASNYGYSPFYRNTSLRSVVITDKEEEIYDNEFYGCTNLKNVVIGDGVRSIGNWAFSGCSSLDHFTFGSGLEKIGNEAFSDCTAITEITTRRTVPPVCGSQALDDINKWDCTLHVPEENVPAYAQANQWMEFLFAEGLSDDVHTLTFNLDGKLYQLDYHTHGSVIIPPTAPTLEGYTFNGWEDLPSYMPDGNLTINGSYTVNPYKLSYYLDGVLYKESEVNYGTAISALADPTKEGWYYFSGWNEVPETMPAHNVSIYGTLNPYTLGDVNNDNDISVTDVVGIGNLILGTNTEGLIRDAANVNQDETVSVADMIYECNVILGNNTLPAPSKVRSKQRMETTASASLEMNDVVLGKDELIISLLNPYDEITGMQLDLYLPKGLRIAEEVDEFDGTTTSDITLMGRTNYLNHALSAALQEDGALRILLSSQSLKTLSGQEGGIIKIHLEADEELEADALITLDHIELGKADNTSMHPAAVTATVSAGEATRIQTVAGQDGGKAYDLTGRQASEKSRGIVISQGRKAVRK